jgi:hypothetical protein
LQAGSLAAFEVNTGRGERRDGSHRGAKYLCAEFENSFGPL